MDLYTITRNGITRIKDTGKKIITIIGGVVITSQSVMAYNCSANATGWTELVFCTTYDLAWLIGTVIIIGMALIVFGFISGRKG